MVAIVVILFGLLVFLPGWWVKRTMKEFDTHRADLPGTGGELAQHLLRHFELDGVRLERGKLPPHYDPRTRTIHLDTKTYDGRSITAVAVAAHEFGHAMQHADGEVGLRIRQAVMRVAAFADKFATFFFIAAPVLGLVTRSPAGLLVPTLIGIGLIAIRLAGHLVTLPVEYDASFGKALPILREGGYLGGDDLARARSVLKAAALTYVAQAAMGLLDFTRWLRGLRF